MVDIGTSVPGLASIVLPGTESPTERSKLFRPIIRWEQSKSRISQWNSLRNYRIAGTIPSVERVVGEKFKRD